MPKQLPPRHLLSVCFALPLLLSVSPKVAAQELSNVVVILVDDLGWTDLGYSGSTFYESPNIDRFSRESVQFTQAYASGSVCSPSRAAILTGKHPARLGITDWIPGSDPRNRPLLGPEDRDELALSQVTLAEVFASRGYRTFFAGKWHLGGGGYGPEAQGFEVNVGGIDAGSPPGGYYSPYQNPKLTDGPDGEYLTDRLTDESLHFLDTVGEAPFLLYLSFYSVHTPIQACERHLDRFASKLAGSDGMDRHQRSEGNGYTVLNQRNPAYASMVYAMDENVGRLIERLRETGRYDNTTIVFTSDNGGLSTLPAQRGAAPTSVLPLRAGKGWLYEGGIRVPLLIKPAGYGGKPVVHDTPVVGHDLFPTLLGLAGAAGGFDFGGIDGTDLSPLVTGTGSLPERELFWHYPHYHGSTWTPGAAVRRGRWKLIVFDDPAHVELYDLDNDLSETTDLSVHYPAVVSMLRARLQALQQESGARPSRPNPDFRPR